MAAPRTLSLLNLIMVALNFGWIAFLESGFLFNYSFTDTISFYPSYLTPAKFTYKIWIFTGLIMISAAYLMYQGTQKNTLNINTFKKVQKIDYLLILNQTALGLSMALKHHDYFLWSIIFSTICLVSILGINRRIEIKKLTSNSFTRYFIRLGFGVYTGWLIFVLGFNSTAIISKFGIQIGEELFFYLNILVFALITIAISLYSYLYYLPTVSAVLVWGSYGAFHQLSQYPLSENYNFKPLLIGAMTIGSILTAYNYYRCSVRRNIQPIIMQKPPSIT